MTKQLREWTAPEDYHTVRYNPASNELELKALDGWRVWHPNARFVLDHADALNALRADPYVAPKGLRDSLRAAMTHAYDCGKREVAEDWRGMTAETAALLALIDRERPALGEVDGEVLVGELVRRGYESREMGYSSLGAVMYSGSKTEDPRKVYGLKCGSVRRVLIAPERAG